jgi:hypothetical protein
LKEKVLDRTVWRARFGRGFGSVVRQTIWMNNKSQLHAWRHSDQIKVADACYHLAHYLTSSCLLPKTWR